MGSGLVTILQGLQGANATNTGQTNGSNTNNNGSSSSSQAGTNAGSAQCQGLSRELSNETQKWQQLAMHRPSQDEALEWCRKVTNLHANFENIIRRAEQAGCTSMPQGILSQIQQISRANCNAN